MRFAWQGFQLDHPDDWAPAVLTGNRSEGYVRIASTTRFSLQIRWKKADKAPDLSVKLTPYLDKLAKDTRRAKVAWSQEVEELDGKSVYRYQGIDQGRGMLFWSEPCKRVFFLEATAGRKDGLLPTFRDLVQGFASEGPAERERWAVLGLDVLLPSGLDVEGRKFQTGRTQLLLASKKLKIAAERWGFGLQLAGRHGLHDWVRAVAQVPRAEALLVEDDRVELFAKSMLKQEHVLAELDREHNQIQWVKVTSRSGERASWEWLAA